MTALEPQLPSLPFNPTPIPQRVDMQEIVSPEGAKLIMLIVVQPLATVAVYLDHDAARKLADQLFTRANGLQIARDMPGGTT